LSEEKNSGSVDGPQKNFARLPDKPPFADTLHALRLKAMEFANGAVDETDPELAAEMRNLADSYARQAAALEAGIRRRAASVRSAEDGMADGATENSRHP
jgi:hypothetical protein